MSGNTKDSLKKSQEKNAPETPTLGDIKLVEEVDAAALWMRVPRKQREPATQLELAEHLGLSSNSTTDWKKRALLGKGHQLSGIRGQRGKLGCRGRPDQEGQVRISSSSCRSLAPMLTPPGMNTPAKTVDP